MRLTNFVSMVYDDEKLPKRGTTPMHVAWADMKKMVDAGLTKAIGVSNFSCLLINDMLIYARIPPAVNQIEVHPYYTNEALAQWCLKKGLQVTAYSPLGVSANVSIADSGLKAGGPMKDPVVIAIAKKHGATPAQVVLNWGIAKGYNVLSKSTKASRIKENFDCHKLKLTDDEVKQITALNKNWKVCNHATEFGMPLYD